MEWFRLTASCATEQPVLAGGYRPSPVARAIEFAPVGQPAVLRGQDGRRRVMLDVAHDYRIAAAATDGLFDLVTVAYSSRILDLDEQELLAYHWHPEGESNVITPHFHLTSRVRPIPLGRGREPVALGEMHLPAGPVRFAGVVRLLIAEVGVAPRRADWDAVLAEDAP